MEIINTKEIPMMLISPNMGQIEGLPSNPRILDEKSMRFLMKSIQDNPEMLNLRELLVYEHKGEYVIIGGNMRYRAMRELGYETAPCKVIPADTTIEALRAYTIKDNVAYGEWNQEDLETWNADDLENWGVILRHHEEQDEAEDEVVTATLSFTLTPEQFKYVKKVFREEADTDAEALKMLVRNYGRA